MKRQPRKPSALTPRQALVLQLVSEGCSNKEIAERLRISLAGAKKHLEVLFRRYGVSNRTALVRAAMERGDFKLPRKRRRTNSQQRD